MILTLQLPKNAQIMRNKDTNMLSIILPDKEFNVNSGIVDTGVITYLTGGKSIQDFENNDPSDIKHLFVHNIKMVFE